MRVALLALLLVGCAVRAPVMPPVQTASPHAPADDGLLNAARQYIMRPDADPATIATIRQRIKSHRTRSLRQFIKDAPHVTN